MTKSAWQRQYSAMVQSNHCISLPFFLRRWEETCKSEVDSQAMGWRTRKTFQTISTITSLRAMPVICVKVQPRARVKEVEERELVQSLELVRLTSWAAKELLSSAVMIASQLHSPLHRKFRMRLLRTIALWYQSKRWMSLLLSGSRKRPKMLYL